MSEVFKHKNLVISEDTTKKKGKKKLQAKKCIDGKLTDKKARNFNISY